MRLVILILAILTFSSSAYANDEHACVRYQRVDYSWGDWYKIPYVLTTGSDLNRALNTYEFASYQKYVLATWPNEGYSLFEVPSYTSDLQTYSSINTEDQNGKTYEIKKAPAYGDCS